MATRLLAGCLALLLTMCLGCGGMKEKGANRHEEPDGRVYYKEKPVPAEKK